MKFQFVLLAAAPFLAIPAVIHADAGAGASVGMLGGALAGSLSGPAKNRVENSVIGGVAGGLLGYAMGNEAEKQGRVVVNQTLETASSNTTVTWVNPDNNATYLVTPQAARQVHGRICREVTIQAVIDGEQETLAGLSCRDENGQWRLTERATATPAPTQTVVISRPPTQYVVVDRTPVPYYAYPVPGVYFYPGPYGHRGRGRGW